MEPALSLLPEAPPWVSPPGRRGARRGRALSGPWRTAHTGRVTRTVGVEEELLVVDQTSGRPMAVAGKLIAQAGTAVADARAAGDSGDAPGGTLVTEFKQQQLETDTPPRQDLAELERDLRRWRDVAIVAARRIGARVVASGTAPTTVTPQVVPDVRYRAMAERYGLTATEHLTCGCHVHVAVCSDDEGVAALNRIRIWLPALLALSANSPFWQGRDTRYASFRSQAMGRWPSSGPTDLYASGADYRATVERMVASGVLMDPAMVYLDARLSARYPTIDIRVADVVADVRDAVLIAALCRALVETAVQDADAGRPAPPVPTTMLRLAMWQASREGLEGALLDPLTCQPRPATEVIAELLEHVRPALRSSGDDARVEEGVARLLREGTGAHQQRSVLQRTDRIGDVVAQLARVTAGMTT